MQEAPVPAQAPPGEASAAPPGDAITRAAGLFQRRRPYLIALVVAIALGAALHPFPRQFVFRHGGDCVRYLTWSKAVTERWLLAFPALVDEYRHRWVGFPPPTRWLWLLLVAVARRIWTQPADEYHPLVLISWLSAVLAVVPIAYWMRRRAPAPAVAVALLLTATAPLSRAMGHFPLPDAVHALFCITLLALVDEWLREPRRALLWAIGAASVAVAATRETGLFNLMAAGALVLVDAREHGRFRRQPLLAIVGGGLAMVAITIPLAGGPRQLVGLAYDVVHAALYTSGTIAYVTGPYYRYLVDFTILSPLVVVTAIASIGALRRRPDLRTLTDHVLAATVVGFFLFGTLPKTLRYVMVLDTGLRILAALGVWVLYTTPPRYCRWLAGALVVALVAHDLAIYQPLWGKDQIYDPVTWGFTKYLKMIPSFGSPGPPVE